MTKVEAVAGIGIVSGCRLDALLLREWDDARNAPLDPAQVSAGSSRRVWWRCAACGRGWAARVSSRSRGQGCPQCRRAPQRASLAVERPELAPQWAADLSGELTAHVSAGSGRRVWWRCATCQHVWQAQVGSRARRVGRGCPQCLRRRGKRSRGTLVEERPDLVEQSWDADRNCGLSPHEVTCGSQRKVWWHCPHGHHWQAAVAERVRGVDCPRCAGRYEHPLPRTHPHLAAEWDEQVNARPPSSVTAGSMIVVAWRCVRGHDWNAAINDRVKGSGCPRCAGRLDQPLSASHAALTAEWDTTVNGHLSEDLTAGSHRVVGWRCGQGHQWRSANNTRARGADCPQCSRLRAAQELSVARQGEGSPSAKLTAAQVAAIRADPRPNAEVARTYRVTATTIYAIRAGRSWRSVA